ncbi:DUF6508 domain-containing protein [Candidatus Laterigemmans baculatus]|uniref:DUF6508 domain-containing protein n=1 Tax=Candidatus Laterigemmans baculatus TaxID=2770505 RepID=UPI0013DBEF31|nr:DUF6508 domain-containing protein [Candidatus Laterigemmans baculatus]
MTQVTRKQADGILPFLDRFERGEISAGEWQHESGQLPFFGPSESYLEFYKALYEHGWVVPFDWSKWQDEAQRYVESPEKIDTADAATVQKLFTTHARADRFCEGHLAEMFRSGHILCLLRRLRVLRDELE